MRVIPYDQREADRFRFSVPLKRCPLEANGVEYGIRSDFADWFDDMGINARVIRHHMMIRQYVKAAIKNRALSHEITWDQHDRDQWDGERIPEMLFFFESHQDAFAFKMRFG